jgi:hypothetical protein
MIVALAGFLAIIFVVYPIVFGFSVIREICSSFNRFLYRNPKLVVRTVASGSIALMFSLLLDSPVDVSVELVGYGFLTGISIHLLSEMMEWLIGNFR